MIVIFANQISIGFNSQSFVVKFFHHEEHKETHHKKHKEKIARWKEFNG